jgi:hypothetical protein
MGLNWNATQVKDARAIGIGIPEGEQTIADKLAWAKTEHIIFASMVTGLGKNWFIGEADVDKLYDRLSAYEHAIDSPVMFTELPDGPNYPERAQTRKHWLTVADIRARVGLRVNVAPVTDAAFAKTLAEILLRQARERREAERLSDECPKCSAIDNGPLCKVHRA